MITTNEDVSQARQTKKEIKMNEPVSKRRKLTASLGEVMKPIFIHEDEVPVLKLQQSICKREQTYFEFLMNRPFNIIQAEEEKTKFHLMKCLRYRLCLLLDSKKNEGLSSMDDDCFEFELITADGCCLNAENLENTCRKSMYESLLLLIDEFDPAGVAEIFRLLLERRIAISLFQPNFKKHHLSFLRHITLPGVDGIRFGEDKTLMRVAVMSGRQPNQSQTTEPSRVSSTVRAFIRTEDADATTSRV